MTEARRGEPRVRGPMGFRPVRFAGRLAVAPVVTALVVLVQISVLPDPGIAPFPLRN